MLGTTAIAAATLAAPSKIGCSASITLSLPSDNPKAQLACTTDWAAMIHQVLEMWVKLIYRTEDAIGVAIDIAIDLRLASA